MGASNKEENGGDKPAQGVVYPSKVGLGLLIPLIVVFGIGIVSSIRQGDWGDVLIQFGIMLPFVCIFFSISYEVTDKDLIVTTFFWVKRGIPIKSITRIVESNNPLSAPAASLKRLEVYYGKYGSTIISPKDKMGFIAHLKRLSPSIQVELKKKKK